MGKGIVLPTPQKVHPPVFEELINTVMHPVMVSIRDKGDYSWVLSYSYHTTLTKEGGST